MFFLLGPSHYVGFQGVALSQCSSFATVLGDLEIDTECVNELKRFPLFATHDEIHKREHSLELQLAFIKHVFGDIKLVPMVVGLLQEEAEVSLVGQVLKRFLGPDDLIVVSSDFTHYGPRYDYIPFYNGDFPAKVKEMDQDAFGYIRDSDLSGFMTFHKKTGCTICGFYPCSLLLSILPKGARTSLLRYGTSRDTHSEDNDNSVSYLSLVLTRPEAESGWEQPT